MLSFRFMNTHGLRHDLPSSLASTETWLAIGSATALLLYGAARRTPAAALGAVAATPLLYRGITGHGPGFLADVMPEATKAALDGGSRICPAS